MGLDAVLVPDPDERQLELRMLSISSGHSSVRFPLGVEACDGSVSRLLEARSRVLKKYFVRSRLSRFGHENYITCGKKQRRFLSSCLL